MGGCGRRTAARGTGQPSSRRALSPLGATAAPTLAGGRLSGGLRTEAYFALRTDPLAPAAVLRERNPTPPDGGTEERGGQVSGSVFRPRTPGRAGQRRGPLETSRSLAQASPGPALRCYPCGRFRMLPMLRAVPACSPSRRSTASSGSGCAGGVCIGVALPAEAAAHPQPAVRREQRPACLLTSATELRARDYRRTPW